MYKRQRRNPKQTRVCFAFGRCVWYKASPKVATRGRKKAEEAEPRLESRLESKLAAKVLLILAEQQSGKSALAQRLGHKTVSGELHKQIKRLVAAGLIQMTIPDKPTSRLQKYRLTEKGHACLKKEVKEL